MSYDASGYKGRNLFQETYFWISLAIISSALSVLVNFVRYTVIVNKGCINFTGCFVVFFSVLFRQLSFLILFLSAIYINYQLYHIYLYDTFFKRFARSILWMFWPILLFLFLLVQDATSLFFSQQKFFANSFTDYLIAFWTSIAGHKKYVICFPKVFNKIWSKFNLSKIMLPLGIIFKVIFYILAIMGFFLYLDRPYLPHKNFFFLVLLIGFISELLSYFSKFIYYKYCHVWKDILPVERRKRNLNMFSSELEIISEEEGNMPLLNKNLP